MREELKIANEQGIAREAALRDELEVANAKIRELQKRVFGKKTEKQKHADDVPGLTPGPSKPRGQQCGKTSACWP